MNKYLMLDRGILDPQGMENVQLTVNPAVKDTETGVLFGEGWLDVPSKPWEVRYDNGYPNVIYDPQAEVYRCYYTTFSTDHDSANTPLAVRPTRQYLPENSRITSLCYAESIDGVQWVKPELHKVDLGNGGNNNVLMQYAHGTGVMLDEDETDPRKRYKLVTKIEYPGHYSYMAVSWSANGLDWHEPVKWPKHNPAADSHNFLFRDRKDGRFKVITRIWKNGLRLSAISESTDFYNWSEPLEVLRGNGFEEQIYSMPMMQYNGYYIGFPSIFHEGERDSPDFDRVDCELAYATTTGRFDRVAPGQSFITRGAGRYPDGEFDCGCIYTSPPVEKDGVLWFYYMGSNGQHTNFRETVMARAWVKQDRLASYSQRSSSGCGVLPISRMRIFGEKLLLLAEGGSKMKIEAAICSNHRQSPYEGYDYSDCTVSEVQGGDDWLTISFNKKFAELDGRSTCIMIKFNDARIFAIAGELECENIRY